MKKYYYWLPVVVCLFFMGCETENIEEKYYQKQKEDPFIPGQPGDSSGVPGVLQPRGEIAWFPLNGNLNDSTQNNIHAFVNGEAQFVEGLNTESGRGLYLNGASCLMIDIGYYDTLAVLFWIKGDEALSTLNKPVLCDYGLNAISAGLDASTGATQVHVSKDEATTSSKGSGPEALNSFEKYSFFYFEAGGDFTRVYFKGYYSNGEEKVYHEEIDFPGVIDPASEIMYIGSSSLREGRECSYFTGAIDEIHIYSHGLTSQEIEAFAFTKTQ